MVALTTQPASRPAPPAAPSVAEQDAERRDGVLAADPVVRSALVRRHRPRTVNHLLTGIAVGLWAAGALLVALVPPTRAFTVHGERPALALASVIAVGLAAVWALAARPGTKAGLQASRWLGAWAPWWIALAVVFALWELATAKTGALTPPYFPPPGQLVTEAWTDRVLLGQSIGNSLALLAVGLFCGGITGLATGLWMGWSKQAGYWLNPIVRYIGPVPTLAWIPIVFIAFPSSFSAAVFLIALTVWFPMTVLTSAGIRSVPRDYFDVCQTLGASNRFLIFKVSLPAALPNIFTGIFMALPTAFVTLTIAETLGVNSGLGWYINWKKGWSAYPAMYAAIAVMVVLCGSLLNLELAIRNRVLAWQKDLTRW